MARATQFKKTRTPAEVMKERYWKNNIAGRLESLINKTHEYHTAGRGARVQLTVAFNKEFHVYTTQKDHPDWVTPIQSAMEKEYPPPNMETPETWEVFLAEKRARKEKRAEAAAQARTCGPQMDDMGEPETSGSGDSGVEDNTFAGGGEKVLPCMFQPPPQKRGPQTTASRQASRSIPQSVTPTLVQHEPARFVFAPSLSPHPPPPPYTSVNEERRSPALRWKCLEPLAGLLGSARCSTLA